MANAQWLVEGTEEKGGYIALYLMSADLRDPKEAKKRALEKAKDRWARKGVKVAKITDVRCVG